MGNLIVVGTGIKSLAHLTKETITVLKKADKVLYLINEPALQRWIERENNHCESLAALYFSFEKRIDAYHAITEYIIEEYHKHNNLCVVFYGHPTLLANSAVRAVSKIKKSGGKARILPAISSLDCLFSDLELDPGDSGFYVADATDFLIYNRTFDTRSHLILLQVGSIGTHNYDIGDNLSVLKEYLQNFYPKNHTVFFYEAPQYPTLPPTIHSFDLSDLENREVSGLTTLYVPPVPGGL